jgi:hypothetical protein
MDIKKEDLIYYIIDTSFSLQQDNLTEEAKKLYQEDDDTLIREKKQIRIAKVKLHLIARVISGVIATYEDCNRYFITDYRVLYNYNIDYDISL